jgi:hypothetical protein
MKFNPKSAWKVIREIQEGLKGHHTAPSDMKMKVDNGVRTSKQQQQQRHQQRRCYEQTL